MTIKYEYININSTMSDYLDPNNEELLKDFFMEAQMQLEALEQNILALESDPSNRDSIDEIFRAAHTLKGSSATVQMQELTGFTHLLEDVLDDIRSEKVGVTSDVVDVLLESIDIIKLMLESRTTGKAYGGDTSSLEARLRTFLSGSEINSKDKTVKRESKKKKVKKETSAPLENEGISEYELLELIEAAGDSAKIFKISIQFNEDNPMNTVGGIQAFAALKAMGKVLKTIPEFELLYEDRFFPVVEYFITSDADKEDITRKIAIPDVVLGSTITEVSTLISAKPPEKAEEIRPAAVSSPVTEESSTEPAIKGDKEEETSLEEKLPDEKGSGYKADNHKKVNLKSSVLRVDSRRIDVLLNLISEAVINKATFNQLSSYFAEMQFNFHSAKTLFREKQKELFDNLPEYLERINEGTPIKQVKKDISTNFGDMFSIFDSVETELKTTIASFRGTAQNLGRITGELHEKVLQIRMVPISQIFSRFPRLVRDVSKSLDKRINLVIEGEETELDKSVIEDLLDPLIHCVRNSVDHGIEQPAERTAAGKTEEGTVLLKASNEGNLIIIEISDNGKGIDIDAVRQRAVERGIIHPGKQLSNIEAFNLIFAPGFSTARSITNISGRGVGLDVVKKQIEKLNGSVTVWSEKGIGTKITIKLPLTLAIIQGLLVKVENQIYAIPITSVLESFRIKPSEIKLIDNYEVFNVREDVVSLLRLNRLFGLPSMEKVDFHYIVVVGSEDKKMGLIVDGLLGEEDVVIKPLRDRYTNTPGIAGATILGDGTVSLIIDVSQLLELGLTKEREQRKLRESAIH